MSRIQRNLFASIVASTMMGACSSSPNVPDGHLICQGPSECPPGDNDGSTDLTPLRDGPGPMSETAIIHDGPVADRNVDLPDDLPNTTLSDSRTSDSDNPDSALPDLATPDLPSPEATNSGDGLLFNDTLLTFDGPSDEVAVKADSADGLRQFVQCRDANDCAKPTNPCVQATCRANTCGTENVAASATCAGNGTCDGTGRCIGPVGKSCQGTPSLSCQGVAANGSAQTVSCCQSMLVGGSYAMGRGTSDDCPTSMSCSDLDQPEHTATVSTHYLDAFEVTVGRFRKFYLQYQGPYVTPNAGTNPNIGNSGWDGSWNSSAYLPETSTILLTNIIQCANSSWPTAGDPNPPDPEQRPVNCVTWYEAFAFCVYDGGRLPTEAEWEFAAAGGDANRFYPWGSYDPALTMLPINYYNNMHSTKVSVGSAPTGVGRFGQLDLLGSVNEWILDGISTTWYASASPCTDCADLLSADITYRGVRGGAWSSSSPSNLRSAARVSAAPSTRSANYGIRCVHDRTQ